MKIYVGNLAPDATEDDLRAVFSSYGDAFVRLMLEQPSGDSRGFGYVEMENDSEAQAAIQGLDGKEFNDRVLVVTAAPRDLGTVQFTRPVLEKAETSAVRLLARGGDADGSTLTLAGAVTTIGRALFNDIVVDEPGVSRQHAAIHRDPDGYRIADLGSRNGTFVNGARVDIELRRQRNMDRIEVGGTNIAAYWVFTDS